jgi:hypothetical protein
MNPPLPAVATVPATLAPPVLEPLPATTEPEPPLLCVGDMVPVPAVGTVVPLEPEPAVVPNESTGASVLHAPADKPLSTHAEPMDSNRLMFTCLR